MSNFFEKFFRLSESARPKSEKGPEQKKPDFVPKMAPVLPKPESVRPRASEWSRTEMVVTRLEGDPRYSPPTEGAPYGEYNHRHIIGRDCPINGGVYVGAGKREMLVVDDSADEELLNLYAELLRRRMADIAKNDRVFNQGVLEEVFKLVKEKMPNDESFAEHYAFKFKNKELPVGKFLMIHGGVCRHHSMVVGYLLEKLVKEGYLQGTVSADRNQNSDGAHVWIRYTNRDGSVFIIDPTQNYIGPLHDPNSKHRWDYFRPGEEKK